METEDLAERLPAALADGDPASLREALEGAHPADIAEVLNELEPADIWRTLGAIDAHDRAEAFGYLLSERQLALARTLDRRQLAHIFRHMSSDDRADLFNRLDPEQQEELLPSLAQAEREDIRQLADYGQGTAGAVMTSEYATLSPDLTAGQAIARLRLEAPDKETIYQAYVIDGERRVLGTVSLRELITARSSELVRDLMTTEVIARPASDPQQEVASLVSKYDLLALPIVDEEERLVGIVTYDDAMDIAEEEATEDFHRVGTVASLESSVREAGIQLLYRKRVSWLVVLIFANALSGTGISFFEDTIAAHVALVYFLPLLIASSGNAGAQSATMTVRALATGDIRMQDWGRMLGRELLVALLLGLTMALVVSLFGLARGGAQIGTVVALTMVLVVIIGSILGMSLPFVLERLQLDPATASVPLVTSLADICGVLIYFSLASSILQIQ